MRRKFSPITLACLPILACGGGGGGKVDSGIRLTDSGSGSGSGSATCTAAASYSPVFTSGSNGNEQAENFPGSGSGSTATPHTELFLGVLNSDPDGLDIELYQGFGAFGSGDIKTGTFPLTGAEAAYSTCGACVLIWTNIKQVGSNGIAPTDYYMANGGSLTLTSVSGNITGSLSNVTFAHVGSAMGSPTDTAVGDCNSMIGSASFSTPLVAGSAAAGIAPSTFQLDGEVPIVLHHRYQ